MPPTGWEQATAFVPTTTPNAIAEAQRKARKALVARICVDAPGCCPALASRVTSWETHQDADTACAMAVVNAKEVEAWRQACTSLDGFDRELARAATELLQDAPGSVAVGKVEDQNTPGGLRAKWLRDRMVAALGQAGARVVKLPRDWDGGKLPRGVDLVVFARSHNRKEGQRAMVEVLWTGRRRGKKGTDVVLAAAPVLLPEAAAPKQERGGARLPTSDPNLSIRVESAPDGSVCLGQRTQLRLYSRDALHVRVFNLYGDGKALLLFPNRERPVGRIGAGETLELGGPRGFEIVTTPGTDQERYLVVATKRPQALGVYGAWTDTCRVPTELAAALSRGELPPGTRGASEGFRVVQIDDCPEPGPDLDRGGTALALERIPECR